MTAEKIKELVANMTLEEKAGMCSGMDFWHTKPVERLGIPSIMVSDGPHGLRKQDDKADHLGVNESIKAVCFPTACATAASFNRELLTSLGETIGNECQAEQVSTILGPGANIKRSPIGGRNFEYFSEDPLVATELAGAFIHGVQSKNIGTSLKHFLANNQETRRMSCSSNIDERTLREIYLAAFEGAVIKEKPWTVMNSYNCVNGVHTSQSKKFLTDILRDEWGFDGFVVSDWGAVDSRPEDLAAGLDLEMPSSNGENDKLIVEAVKNGALDEKELDQAVERILSIIYRYEDNKDTSAVFDRDADHEKARKMAEETIVLLKNDGILPLQESMKVAFIGKYAAKPRYQGGGSSHINSHKVTSAVDAAAGNPNVVYAQGFDDAADVVDEAMLAEAVDVAKNAEVAVIFAGLPDAFESEGFDREHMRMPACQNELISRICEVQEQVIVVLHNGSPVEMPWISKVKGVVEAYLGGQAVGGAEYDILFGKVNPSAKLAETFPLRLEDNPSYLFFPGEGDVVNYQEGIFVGYRYYDKKNMEVLFPFGYGLSYTTYAYSNLQLDKKHMKDTETLTVSVDVTNTGSMAGKEIIQVYVADQESSVIRPKKELREFAKVFLQPGETKTVTFTLGKRSFAYYNTEISNWFVESGNFDIMIGASSRDIRLQDTVWVEGTTKLKKIYHLDSTLGDIKKDPKAKAVIEELMKRLNSVDGGEEEENSAASEAITAEMQEAMQRYMPIRGILSFNNGTVEDVIHVIAELNSL